MFTQIIKNIINMFKFYHIIKDEEVYKGSNY